MVLKGHAVNFHLVNTDSHLVDFISEPPHTVDAGEQDGRVSSHETIVGHHTLHLLASLADRT